MANTRNEYKTFILENVVRNKLSHYRPGQASRRLRLPDFLDYRHLKMVRLSALRTGRLYHQDINLMLITVRV
jgi:hypothetical protein